jgi:transcriptional regulator with XRE-family HTH domain
MEIRIGEKIKQLRNLNNITQKQLANAIGCTEIMISRYELGIVNISISQIGKIAKHFNVAPGYFFEQNSESVNNTDNRVAKQVFIFDLDDTLVDGRQFCGETIARVITEKDPSQPLLRIG